ncbi:hypothetical protein [Leptospira noguchii]|uniref:hypothetical protein n=1 Tax=Leptospira noguchii TaxID=28182 RepID=UPI0003285044|nr:hypothetical protein [Leptospira noguchii]EMS86350.1 hypothetical protein LEP1GSC073_0439 [Leptospira noguchii str. Cascata]
MNPKNRKSKTNSSKVPKKKSHKPKKTAGKKKTTTTNLRKKTIKKIPSPKLISQVDYLDPTVKFVSPKKLKPNPRNDFDPLTTEEYNNLKQNIITNGILDPLTAKKDGMIVTGENRYNIVLELQTHEDKEVRRRVSKIPVRFYLKRLTEEEYERIESDNLFRRHMTPEQRKQRIKRLYKSELIQDNRGGDRRKNNSHKVIQSEFSVSNQYISKKQYSNLHPEGLNIENNKISKQIIKTKGVYPHSDNNQFIHIQEKLNIAPRSSKEDYKDVAKKISVNEKIPLGTASRYVAEIRKELLPQESKPEKKSEETKDKPLKEIVREFRKRFTQMTKSQKESEINRLKNTIIKLSYEWDRLNRQVVSNEIHRHQIFEKLKSVGEGDVIYKVNNFLNEKEKSRIKK